MDGDRDAPAAGRIIDRWELGACLFGAIGLCALAALPLYERFIAYPIQPWHRLLAFALICLAPLATSWIKAVLDGQLPARPGAQPQLDHISGWNVLLLAIPIVAIGYLAVWAASDSRTINALWGLIVVALLVAAFAFAAWAPSWNLDRRASWLVAILRPIVAPLGLLLSIIDSLLVFVVAGASGAALGTVQMRYLVLFGILVPCGVLGYTLAPPYGLIPIVWGCLVALSMSRRWAWVEDDRELAMLNGRFVGPHLRIGFEQDLRDEAMLSFMSMFFLIPLALRQIQGWEPIFDMGQVNVATLLDWLAFYGAELAKAVPFVDWAEIYNVHGDAGIQIGDDPRARHVIFGTRVLVDVVFLAALLQALAISARNAKQQTLFQSGSLPRLDPFIEKSAFRRLVRRGENGVWEPIPKAIDDFPRYDPVRLGELSDKSQPLPIQAAAKALRLKQGGANAAEFHAELLTRAVQLRDRQGETSKEDVMEVVLAIRSAGPDRDINKLEETRLALNGVARTIELRTQVIRLLFDAPDSAERTRALLNAIQGPKRDYLGPVRAVAIAGLAEAASRDELGVVAAITEAAEGSDSTNAEKREARAILKRLNRG